MKGTSPDDAAVVSFPVRPPATDEGQHWGEIEERSLPVGKSCTPPSFQSH